MQVTVAGAASPALVCVAPEMNPHVVADICTAARLLDRYRVPPVIADTLVDKSEWADRAGRVGKIAGMVAVVDHT